MFSDPLREVLVAYWRWKRPAEWLFPGEKPGRPIARETVFEICRKAARLAGIAKPVHPHSLRHYAASRTMPRVGARTPIHGPSNRGDAA